MLLERSICGDNSNVWLLPSSSSHRLPRNPGWQLHLYVPSRNEITEHLPLFRQGSLEHGFCVKENKMFTITYPWTFCRASQRLEIFINFTCLRISFYKLAETKTRKRVAARKIVITRNSNYKPECRNGEIGCLKLVSEGCCIWLMEEVHTRIFLHC